MSEAIDNMGSKGSFNRLCCYFEDNDPEEILGEDAKTIKELFPSIVDDFTYNDERERSLCPAFMKSGSASLSFAQGELVLKQPLATSIDQQKEDTLLAAPDNEEEAVAEAREDVSSEKEREDVAGQREKHNRKFTRDEDERLRSLVKLHGEGAWLRIAENMPGRNRKQVRERYINFLKKERVTSEFTPAEDAVIVQNVHKQGRKWSLIAELLVGRTPIMIKNRYYTKLRKSMRAEERRKSKSDAGSSLSTSQGDLPNGEPANDVRPNKDNKGSKEVRVEENGIERLKAQEENLKAALSELRIKIAKAREESTDS